jgi:hypothetical protein
MDAVQLSLDGESLPELVGVNGGVVEEARPLDGGIMRG